MRRALLGCVLLSMFLASPTADSQYYYGCQGYGQQRVQYWQQCNCYSCAYTGPGCTACFNESTGAVCYTDATYCDAALHQTP